MLLKYIQVNILQYWYVIKCIRYVYAKFFKVPSEYTTCEDWSVAGQSWQYSRLLRSQNWLLLQTVYCSFDFNIPCGNGRWFPVALLDMSKGQQTCPTNFNLFEEQGVRGCVIPAANAPGCASTKFNVNGLE